MDKLMLGTMQNARVETVRANAYGISVSNVSLTLPKEDALRPLNTAETIPVFLYADHHKRVVATMKQPHIDRARGGLVDVVETVAQLGVFVDIGIKKDMLVSKDELPARIMQWPIQGDRLFCVLRQKGSQLLASPLNKAKMKQYFPGAPLPDIGAETEAIVFDHTPEGIVLYTALGADIFVYAKHTRRPYRLGETVHVTVLHHHPDQQSAFGTLIDTKENMLDADGERLLAYMKANGGRMAFTDKSDADDIRKTFQMSKAAFKRALGALYKKRLVVLHEDGTTLA